MYRDQITEHGETIAIRRYSGTGAGRTYVDRDCLARVTGYSPSELVGSIIQGDRKVIVLADDLDGESPPFAIAKTDKVVVRDKELAIMMVDDSTRRVGGTLIAYELTARG